MERNVVVFDCETTAGTLFDGLVTQVGPHPSHRHASWRFEHKERLLIRFLLEREEERFVGRRVWAIRVDQCTSDCDLLNRLDVFYEVQIDKDGLSCRSRLRPRDYPNLDERRRHVGFLASDVLDADGEVTDA